MIARAFLWLVPFVAIAACGSSSNQRVSAGPPSCTVTLSGALSGTHSCQALVGYYQGQLAVVITGDDDAQFQFGTVISSTDDLAPGHFDASSVQQEAASVQGTQAGDATTADAATFASAQQTGQISEGSFVLDIDSVGPEVSSIYEGTKGSIDTTLVQVGGSASNTVDAHVDFISIGGGGSDHDDDDGGDDSTGSFDGGSVSPPCSVTLSEAVSATFPCAVAATSTPGSQFVDVTITGQNTDGSQLSIVVEVLGSTLTTKTYNSYENFENATYTYADAGVGASQGNTDGGDINGNFELTIESVSPPASSDAGQQWSNLHGLYDGDWTSSTGGAPTSVTIDF